MSRHRFARSASDCSPRTTSSASSGSAARVSPPRATSTKSRADRLACLAYARHSNAASAAAPFATAASSMSTANAARAGSSSSTLASSKGPTACSSRSAVAAPPNNSDRPAGSTCEENRPVGVKLASSPSGRPRTRVRRVRAPAFLRISSRSAPAPRDDAPRRAARRLEGAATVLRRNLDARLERERAGRSGGPGRAP